MVMEKAVQVEKRGEMKMEIISDMTAEQETLLERLKMFLMMADGNVFTVAAPMLASLVDVDLQTAEAVADKLRGLNITVAVEADGEQKQNNADFGHLLNLVRVLDKPQGVRTGQHTGGKETDDGRKT